MVPDHLAAHPGDVCTPYELPTRGGEVLFKAGHVPLVRDQSRQGQFEVFMPGTQSSAEGVAKEVMSLGVKLGPADAATSSFKWTPESVLTEQVIGLFACEGCRPRSLATRRA